MAHLLDGSCLRENRCLSISSQRTEHDSFLQQPSYGWLCPLQCHRLACWPSNFASCERIACSSIWCHRNCRRVVIGRNHRPFYISYVVPGRRQSNTRHASKCSDSGLASGAMSNRCSSRLHVHRSESPGDVTKMFTVRQVRTFSATAGLG